MLPRGDYWAGGAALVVIIVDSRGARKFEAAINHVAILRLRPVLEDDAAMTAAACLACRVEKIAACSLPINVAFHQEKPIKAGIVHCHFKLFARRCGDHLAPVD